VPRQTGKTTLFLAFQIHRCTAPRWSHPQRSAFTAQSGKDARDKWLDELFPLIRRSRKLKPLVRRIYEGMGNEYISFTNGSLIRLLSTSSSSGHSKTLHQSVLDEIWHDTDNRREQGLGPAMITIADAQVLVCSTAGTAASVVLDRQMELGRAAAREDSGHGIAYFEYSAPEAGTRWTRTPTSGSCRRCARRLRAGAAAGSGGTRSRWTRSAVSGCQWKHLSSPGRTGMSRTGRG